MDVVREAEMPSAGTDQAAEEARRVRADEVNRLQCELMLAAVARLVRRRELLASSQAADALAPAQAEIPFSTYRPTRPACAESEDI